MCERLQLVYHHPAPWSDSEKVDQIEQKHTGRNPQTQHHYSRPKQRMTVSIGAWKIPHYDAADHSDSKGCSHPIKSPSIPIRTYLTPIGDYSRPPTPGSHQWAWMPYPDGVWHTRELTVRRSDERVLAGQSCCVEVELSTSRQGAEPLSGRTDPAPTRMRLRVVRLIFMPSRSLRRSLG